MLAIVSFTASSAMTSFVFNWHIRTSKEPTLYFCLASKIDFTDFLADRLGKESQLRSSGSATSSREVDVDIDCVVRGSLGFLQTGAEVR